MDNIPPPTRLDSIRQAYFSTKRERRIADHENDGSRKEREHRDDVPIIDEVSEDETDAGTYDDHGRTPRQPRQSYPPITHINFRV
jgi:hypothetical protein